MFLPIKPDFPLPRFPWLTALVCLVCVLVYVQQSRNWSEYQYEAIGYCEVPRSRLTDIVLQQISATEDGNPCLETLLAIDYADDPDAAIRELADHVRPLAGFDPAESRDYVVNMLTEEFRRYRIAVPAVPDRNLAYHSASWNPLLMITSSFSHGSWSHLIFNLVFFIAFATAMEVLIGGLSFIGVIVAVSLFTATFSSLSGIAAGQHFSTLGLSGVVMGMIGLYAYVMPRGRIRCFYWFVVFFGTAAVPAWALALWFVGGDIVTLFTSEDHGVVDVLSHVTGGIAGYLYGVLLLRKARDSAEGLQMGIDHGQFRPRF